MPAANFISGRAIRVYAWSIFLLVLVICLVNGHSAAWMKVRAYMSAHVTLTGSAQARMVWLQTFYAYAHAYSRMLIGFLVIALVLLLFRMALSMVMSPLEDAEEAPQNFTGKITYMLSVLSDARNLIKFVYPSHWAVHAVAFGIYLVASLFMCFVQLASSPPVTLGRELELDDDVGFKEHLMKSYVRAAIASTGAISLFYLVYVARVVTVGQ